MEINVCEEEKVEKPTPFLKRVSDLEKKVEQLDKKINTILMAMKTRG